MLSLQDCNACFKYIFDYAVQKKETIEISDKKFDIYPCSYIEAMNIDIIIISSYSHRKEIRRELEKCHKDFIILDLYDNLKDNGLDVNAPFYRNASDTYENVIYYRKEYFSRKNASNLKKLITAYLKIYDFINFEKAKLLEEKAKSQLANFQGVDVGYLSRESRAVLKGLNEQESQDFISQLFTKTKAKDYIFLQDKIILYEILDQRLKNSDIMAKNLDFLTQNGMQVKSRLVDVAFMEHLLKIYKIVKKI